MFVIDDMALIFAAEAAAEAAAIEAAATAAATAAAETAAATAAAETAAVSQAPNFAATASQYGAFGEPMTAEAAQGITSVPLPAEPLPPAGSEELASQSWMPGRPDISTFTGAPNAYASQAPIVPGGQTLSQLMGTSGAPASGLDLGAASTSFTPTEATPSALKNGFDTAVKFAKEHPFQTAGLAYMGASATGLLDQKGINPSAPYSGPLSNYRLSPNFQGSHANPEDFQYTPRRYNNGGITQIPSYAKGRAVDSSYFTDMIEQKQAQAAPSSSHNVGIYHDTDPDTMYLDPLTAAMVRQSKLDKRSNVNTAAKFRQPVPMGTLNTKPVAAAHGGIMGANNLGGYASGGNPRLLKGPGDGMSDNIPATINNRQPARLADGEFVIPADVVSHLGNGSTEAGAKRLHRMMTEIRKARTGNPRQGKEINPNRFIPK